MKELKQEVSEERERGRTMAREQDTKLIQSEQRAAILDEQLKTANKQLEKLKRAQGD